MKKVALITAVALLGILILVFRSDAQSLDKTVKVGGEAMFPSKNIVENAVKSKDHTTLVAAVKAGGLVETLQGSGPFTVFAPVNDAFENLPAGTVDGLLKPESKKSLVTILTYHVVPGKFSASDLMSNIKKSGGKFVVKTVSGGNLSFTMNGPSNVQVWDENGNGANISVYDVNQSNGIIHVVDAVLMPVM